MDWHGQMVISTALGALARISVRWALPGLIMLNSSVSGLCDSWRDRMADAWREVSVTGPERGEAQLKVIFSALMKDFAVETDWFSSARNGYELDDQGVPLNLSEYFKPGRDASLEWNIISTVIASMGDAGKKYYEPLEKFKADKVPAGDGRWLELFLEICRFRRDQRLKTLVKCAPKILFVKRHPVKPSFYGYTEGQSDAQKERHFRPPSKLCLLEMNGAYGSARDLLEDSNGVIRDLDVSYDGGRILFAWKKSDREDDYHLYEMDALTGNIRQLTSGLGVADYEGVYLPDGGIMFSSSRCVQTVDCWWTEVSNMYRCDSDPSEEELRAGGKNIRRLGFDQVHTVHPSVMNNGAVVYTRWDYNDRGQIYPQALFQMNPDGTGQSEYYGNNSWFPTVTDHARAIPGSDKLVAVLHGHHSWQAGELALIDRNRGTQENSGVQLIAPVRETKAVKIDSYGQTGMLFRHPCAINEREFIVAMTPDKDARKRNVSFGLYYIDIDGNRELLVYDSAISCNNPVPLQPRKKPHVKSSVVDYGRSDGVYFMQDIYVGPGLEGIERGTVKKLRVVTLEYRAAGIGSNSNGGEAGGAMICTPISIGPGAWDVKRILGETDVYEDGSAMFRVPAQTPVYFQAIDADGCVVQTMRSWSTLMPGETFGCVGCHEDKLKTPVVARSTLATAKGIQELRLFYGPPRGFSFTKEIQPILDKQCVRCHDGIIKEGKDKAVFPLKNTTVTDPTAKRNWTESYMNLIGAKVETWTADSSRPVLNWIDSQSRPSMLPPYHKGSATSEIIKKLRAGHCGVKLDRESMDKFCAWIDLGVPFCGDYLEANAWTDDEMKQYLHFQKKRESLAHSPQ